MCDPKLAVWWAGGRVLKRNYILQYNFSKQSGGVFIEARVMIRALTGYLTNLTCILIVWYPPLLPSLNVVLQGHRVKKFISQSL